MAMRCIHKNVLGCFIVALCFYGQALYANTLKSSVDRYQVGENETVNLVITLENSQANGAPDTTGLNNDFEIVNSSTSSSTQIINGSITSKQEWHYILLPKKIGKLIIPSFRVKDLISDAIEIESLGHDDTQQNNKNAADTQRSELYLEESIDKKEAYLQERITLTLRIFTAVQIARPEIPDPSIPNFMVEKLNQSEYQSRKNDRNYYVLEYKYALFANKSGKVTLPKQRYEINQIINTAPRSMFDIRGFNTPNTQTHFLSSPDLSLTIKPQPDNLPASYWLTGDDISISDDWSEQQSTNAGTPITRNIEIKGLGTLAALIPPLSFDNIPSLKSYPEQPVLTNSHAGDNLLASRKESIAIVPTEAGTFILPAINIHWWDTKTKQFKVSSIPERTLTVKATANMPSATKPITPLTPAEKTPADNNLMSPTSTTTSAITPFYLNIYFWIAATFSVSILCVITLIVLFKKTREIKSAHKTHVTHETIQTLSLKDTLKNLKSACHANDAHKCREQLILWAQLQWPLAKIYTLSDVKKQINNKEFAKIADELDSCLYRGASLWNGTSMLQLLQTSDFSSSRDEQPATLTKLYD